MTHLLPLEVVLQLKRVGQVWQDVNIYCKAMGTLLKTAASELISRILALEDLLRGRQHTARPVCAYSGAFEVSAGFPNTKADFNLNEWDNNSDAKRGLTLQL
ncbi:uncharacterized protein LOC143127377 isoform X3 [Alosa pseudoharengus]|uniref:uncharacterized protein LOC143127377 isoform X3 n=1 Tax=Alosa pseudoharengus TaxID=34774 RepID=UPI003F8AEE4B